MPSIDDLVIDIEQELLIKAPIKTVFKSTVYQLSEGMRGEDEASLALEMEAKPGLNTLELELRDELDGSVFLFTNGTDMTAESERALLVVGAHLAEAQQLAGALGRELTIVLEGLGDGIDTFEKNREVARNRTEQILGEMMEVGLRPDNIRHTIGEWREGGMDLERRRVTLRLDWGEGT